MKIQHQNSMGIWMDCKGRTEQFLALCEKNNGMDATGKIVPAFRQTRPLTRDEVIAALTSGITLRNDPADWYSRCREGEIYERKIAERAAAQIAARDYPEGCKLNCGHIVYYKGNVMIASRGSSCADCYDRMSE